MVWMYNSLSIDLLMVMWTISSFPFIDRIALGIRYRRLFIGIYFEIYILSIFNSTHTHTHTNMCVHMYICMCICVYKHTDLHVL